MTFLERLTIGVLAFALPYLGWLSNTFILNTGTGVSIVAAILVSIEVLYLYYMGKDENLADAKDKEMFKEMIEDAEFTGRRVEAIALLLLLVLSRIFLDFSPYIILLFSLATIYSIAKYLAYAGDNFTGPDEPSGFV